MSRRQQGGRHCVSAKAETPLSKSCTAPLGLGRAFLKIKRERLAEKASRAPELVVIQPLNREWICHKCGESGDLLIMENPGPACMRCAGLDGLVFLPSGGALLTRRAKANGGRFAVVVRFNRRRRHYERQGLLVEPQALTQAQDALQSAARLRDNDPERALHQTRRPL